MFSNDPHGNQEILFKGNSKTPESGMILIHGRGADAEDILSITNNFETNKFIFAAPQAYQNSWYPYSFLSPVESNEPGLASGLNVINKLIKKFNKMGIDNGEIILLGFSQGACLILDYAARDAKKYKAIIGLSGGLIGKEIDQTRYSGSFEQCMVFLGCSNIDPHIPEGRVHQTAEVMEKLNAKVIKRIYKGMGHTINDDEIEYIKSVL